MNPLKPGSRAVLRAAVTVLLFSISVHAAAGILGNRYFSNQRVRDVLPPPLRDFSDFARKEWESSAANAVMRLYRGEGFFDAEVRVEVGRDPGDPARWLTTVWIREEKRYQVGSVRLEPAGEDALPPGLPAPRLRPGEPFRYAEVQADLRRITGFLANRGRLYATAEEAVDIRRDETAARVVYHVFAGPVAVFDTLILDVRHLSAPGDTTPGWTRPEVLRGLAPYRAGDTVTAPRNLTFLRKLYSTGDFLDARIEPRLDSGGGSALILRALEGQGVKYRAAAAYSVDAGFGGEAAFRNGNLFGTLKGAGMTLASAQRRQSVSAEFTSPLVFDRRLDFVLGGQAEWYQGTPLREALGARAFAGDARYSARAGWGFGFLPTWRATQETGAFYDRRAIAPAETRTGLYLDLIQRLHWDWLGPSPFAPQGVRSEFAWGDGGALTAGPEGLSRHDWLETRTAWALPVVRGLATTGRIQGGTFLAPGGMDASRFFLGGSRGLRAFGNARVCPETRMEPAGGDSVSVCVEEGLAPAFALYVWEFRFYPLKVWEPSRYSRSRILAPLSAAAFAEAGAVWKAGSIPSLRSEGAGLSYGFGFRFPLSPEYEFSLDAAWGTRGDGERAAGWSLNLARIL